MSHSLTLRLFAALFACAAVLASWPPTVGVSPSAIAQV